MKSKKLGKNKANGLVAGLVVLIVVIATASLSGCIDEETTEVIVCPTFDITPTGSATAILNSAKDGFTVPAYANQTAHSIIQVDNSTAWADPVLTFEIEPVMAQGMNANDLAQITCDISSPDIKISTATDEYYLVTKTGGNRQWVWDVDGTTKYVSGSEQMLLTENATLTLTIDVNQDSFSRIEDTYDAVSVSVTFSNGCGWSETYSIEFMLTHTW